MYRRTDWWWANPRARWPGLDQRRLGGCNLRRASDGSQSGPQARRKEQDLPGVFQRFPTNETGKSSRRTPNFSGRSGIFTIPGMNICGREVKIQGRLCRVAHLDADEHKFLDDPEAALSELRKYGLRIDLFTFMQKLPETTPKYSYPMEWDNMAVLKVSTFEHWWTRQIRKNTRNKAKQAEKKGVVVREVAFDDTLARGI